MSGGVVPFAELPYRSVYRVRPAEELELALVKLNVDAELRQVRLRSIRSTQQTEITFRNLTSGDVRAVWLDYDGNEVVYTVIEPQESCRYLTFTTHPWVVRCVEDQKRLMINDSQVIFGTAAHQFVDIREPPLLTWTTSTHKFFPEVFRDAVRCILLCHHRLRFGEPSGCRNRMRGSQGTSLVTMGLALLRTRNLASFRRRHSCEPPLGESDYMHAGLWFGNLPRDLVQLVIQKLDPPKVAQDVKNGLEGSPDIKPVWLPEDVELAEFLLPKQRHS